MILLPILQVVYIPPVIYLLITRGWRGEDAITLNIVEVVHPPCDIVPITQGDRRRYYDQYPQNFAPSAVIYFLISERERIILLPKLQGVYTLPVIWSLISMGKEDVITPNITEVVHPSPMILFLIPVGERII